MRIFFVSAGLLLVFSLAACDGTFQASNIKGFDLPLQGTWVSNDSSVYSGTLTITYNRIVITGYNESQTPNAGDDNKRPFKGFIKGIALKGYSEDGKIFIEDGGILQEGIPYTYWTENSPPDYTRIKLLRFTFGGREESLQNE